MTEPELKLRTKSFALRVLKLIDSLPETRSGRVLANQLGRSGTSVGANYRAACRAKSRADFISKMGTVEEEADETGLWLELIGESELLPMAKLEELHREAGELTAIAVTSIRTARKRSATPHSAFRTPQ